MTCLHIIQRVLLKNPFALASILSGLLWFGCLIAPGDTLSRPTYRHMAEIANEEIWAVVFLITALLQLARLTYRITPRNFPFEFALKLWAALMWSSVGLLCIIAQWPLAAAMSDTIVVALFAILDLVKLRPTCQGCPFLSTCLRGRDCRYAH